MLVAEVVARLTQLSSPSQLNVEMQSVVVEPRSPKTWLASGAEVRLPRSLVRCRRGARNRRSARPLPWEAGGFGASSRRLRRVARHVHRVSAGSTSENERGAPRIVPLAM